MNILYIYAHPNSDSFNSMLKKHALNTFDTLKLKTELSDLYAIKFKASADWDDFEEADLNSQYFLAQQKAYHDGTLSADINTEINKIISADHLIFQFPLWWFSVPAILKGWLDRVLVKGFAYDSGKILENGLLKGKSASLVLTTQSPETAYQMDGLHKATIDTFLHHIHHTLRFAGIKILKPFVTYGAFNLDMPQTENIIKNYHTYIKQLIENYHELIKT